MNDLANLQLKPLRLAAVGSRADQCQLVVGEAELGADRHLEFLKRPAVIQVGLQADFAELGGDVIGGQIESLGADAPAFQFIG